MYERFFKEVGKAVDDDAGPLLVKDEPDAERIAAIAVQYGIETSPPMA